MADVISVYVTTASAEEAERIGRALVDERLAACANVIPGVVSIYRWEGAVQRDHEAALVLKTRAALFERIAARVRALHGYEQPCIVAWPIAHVDPGYRRWLEQETEAG
jgi:periplasmic divalent cation tolerance protein